MSEAEQAEAIFDEVSEKIAKDTIPGQNNKSVIADVARSGDIIYETVIEDLNNWVEIVEVRNFGDKMVGIPCRYRWTIKRWVKNDMDEWLMKNGWERLPHLKADSEEHMPNELEARYFKEVDDWKVFVNIWVEFTEDVFDMLDEGTDVEDVSEPAEEYRKKIEILKGKRS